MSDDSFYHDGMRQLQDARETRPIAERLEQVTVRAAFTADDRSFIERCAMFFLATADAHGLYEKFGFTPLAKPERFMAR